jgi:hypothetical protein
MSAMLGGLAINGKLIVIGAGDENIEVSPLLLISGRRSLWAGLVALVSIRKIPFPLVFFLM